MAKIKEFEKMNNNLIAVTYPDDVLQDGNRILLINLTEQQMGMLSSAFSNIADFENVIIYIWKTGDDIEWLLDKKLKSNLIIVNSDCDDQITVGYMIAQANSCYFGTLKNFSKANANAIYDVDQITNILERKIR